MTILQQGGASLLGYWISKGSNQLEVVQKHINTLKEMAQNAPPPQKTKMIALCEAVDFFRYIEVHTCTTRDLKDITRRATHFTSRILRELLKLYTEGDESLYHFISMSVLSIRMGLSVIGTILDLVKEEHSVQAMRQEFQKIHNDLLISSVE